MVCVLLKARADSECHSGAASHLTRFSDQALAQNSASESLPTAPAAPGRAPIRLLRPHAGPPFIWQLGPPRVPRALALARTCARAQVLCALQRQRQRSRVSWGGGG